MLQTDTQPDYRRFLESKITIAPRSGFEVGAQSIHAKLFPFQKDLVRWALRKGRAAIFADTGLGKTFMQLEFARLAGGRSLIVAPLSIARQTVREAKRIDLEIHYTRSGADLIDGINITNYEMVEQFDPAQFRAVVLDESSILKGLDGKTRKRLTAMFAETQYRLCCTATPAPNDISEIANHAEFLGIMTRADMLATFFVHDDDGYRLKGHAKTAFFRWLASWGMSIRKPSDLGYADDGYDLPALTIEPVFVQSDYRPDGQLFFTGLKGITDRADARKRTVEQRVQTAIDLIATQPGQWIVWCGLNDEQDRIAAGLDDCISVTGAQTPDAKAAALEAFQDGEYRVLVTKPSIAGFGMNFQNCARMVFVGLSDSYESYYQCIRRSYRFGQTQPVSAYIILSDVEQEVYANVQRKEREAREMMAQLIDNVQQYEQSEIAGTNDGAWEYKTETRRGKNWTLMLGDSAERLSEVANDSVDFSVFSPPFMSLFTYSPSERDLGNTKDEDEFFAQFGFIIDHLLRATKPGRLCAVHVAQVPAMLVRDNFIGLKDFRGRTIGAFVEHGWIHHGEVVIDKDPQAQAIRTKSKALLFTQLHKDSSWSRPALADFILLFRKPGDNAVPIHPDIGNNEWIEWARPVWYGIRESDTLQYTTARENEDERHICPLQLGTIERCIRLWSNKGETVLSPFAGIGSEGHVALKNGRKFIGCELKESYWRTAVRNLQDAERAKLSGDLFSAAGVEVQ